MRHGRIRNGFLRSPYLGIQPKRSFLYHRSFPWKRESSLLLVFLDARLRGHDELGKKSAVVTWDCLVWLTDEERLGGLSSLRMRHHVLDEHSTEWN